MNTGTGSHIRDEHAILHRSLWTLLMHALTSNNQDTRSEAAHQLRAAAPAHWDDPEQDGRPTQ